MVNAPLTSVQRKKIAVYAICLFLSGALNFRVSAESLPMEAALLVTNTNTHIQDNYRKRADVLKEDFQDAVDGAAVILPEPELKDYSTLAVVSFTGNFDISADKKKFPLKDEDIKTALLAAMYDEFASALKEKKPGIRIISPQTVAQNKYYQELNYGLSPSSGMIKQLQLKGLKPYQAFALKYILSPVPDFGKFSPAKIDSSDYRKSFMSKDFDDYAAMMGALAKALGSDMAATVENRLSVEAQGNSYQAKLTGIAVDIWDKTGSVVWSGRIEKDFPADKPVDLSSANAWKAVTPAYARLAEMIAVKFAADAPAESETMAEPQQEAQPAAPAPVAAQASEHKPPPAYLKALKDPNWKTRAKTAYELGEKQETGAVAALSSALSDKQPIVRAAAAEALGKIGDKKASSKLSKLLNDKDPRVRFFAAQSLGTLGDGKAVPALKKMASGKNAEIKAKAEAALEKLLSKDELEKWRQSRKVPAASGKNAAD